MQSPSPHIYSLQISLPGGWTKECVKRPLTVKTKGRWDFTLRPPTGRKLRSQADLRDYLRDNPGVSLDAAVFNFCIPWATDAPPVTPDLITDAGNEVIDDAAPNLIEDDNPALIADAGNEVIDNTAPNLVEDNNPDLIKNGNQGSPEHSPSPPRGKMSARSICRACF